MLEFYPQQFHDLTFHEALAKALELGAAGWRLPTPEEYLHGYRQFSKGQIYWLNDKRCGCVHGVYNEYPSHEASVQLVR